MKPSTFIVALCALCGWGTVASAQYVWQYVTPEQAVQKVREILGEGNDTPVEIKHIAPPSARPGIDVLHILECNQRRFLICAFNINHWSWLWGFSSQEFYYDEPLSEEMLLRRAIGEEQALAIARSYMQAHYPFPELLNHVEVRKSAWFGRAPVEYNVYFWQRFPNGVYGPNRCTVSVDVVYGRITDAGCVYYPVLVSINPALTAEQAFAAAAQQLQLPNPEAGSLFGIRVTPPDPFGYETLAYELTVYGSDEGRGRLEYVCLVDGFTGALLWWDILMGISSAKKRPVRAQTVVPGKSLQVEWDGEKVHLNRPAIDIGGRAHLWAGYLADRGKPGSLRWERSGRLFITGRGGVVILQKGSNEYQMNGKTFRMSTPACVVGGRLYVPVDVVKQVLGAQVRYDRVKRLVTIRTRA